MTAIFIGGSRSLSRLNEQVRAKLAEITERGLHVLVGDANGADRAVQAQLHDWNYSHVTVFFVGAAPRNNVGGWPAERVPAPSSARGAQYYGAKDAVMARAADAGLMIWDGESKGTLLNVRNLAREQKPVAVYVSKLRRFRNVFNEAEMDELTVGQHARHGPAPHEEQSHLPLDFVRYATARKHRRHSR